MQRLFTALMVVAIVGLIGFGCSQGPDQTISSTDVTDFGQLSKLSVPAGATLVSATLSLYVTNAENQTVYVHRATDPWVEATVSFASYGLAYDATVEGTFVTDGLGWRSVDVTTLVGQWLDETYDNNGFFLRQPTGYVSIYHSSEAVDPSLRPKLEICYSDGGGGGCITIQRDLFGYVEDAYISNFQNLDEMTGAYDHLATGQLGDSHKLTLVKFDMDTPPPCTACLGDTVWYDDNMNGVQDADEAGVEGVEVDLMNCQGEVLATTTTDANGFYQFCELLEGDYSVKFHAPEGYVFTLQNVGDDADDSDADADGLTGCYTLGCDDDPTIDAGIYLREFGGCSLTIGFWKTHAGFGPQANVVSQYLPISLGSYVVADSADAVKVLSKDLCDGSSNGIVKLMAQLLGTKLNAASGADVSAVQDEIDDADAFLTTYDCSDWFSLTKSMKKKVLKWMTTFDDYNNGLIGPGHCD